MMFRKFVLFALAMLPLKSVAFAAQSKLTTLAGEDLEAFGQWDLILKKKSLLLGPYQVNTSIQSAYRRYIEQTGAEISLESQVEFEDLVSSMINQGLIRTDDKMLISAVPSEYAH